jgi:hypothetical protein
VEEKEILELAEAAGELDELNAEFGGRATLGAKEGLAVRSSRRRWGLGAAALVAAAALLLFLWPSELRIDELIVRAPGHRGVDAKIQIELKINRRAFVRVVTVDARFERWITPFDRDETKFIKQVDGQVTLEGYLHPNRQDPRGPAEAILVMAIVSTEATPTTQEILTAIPDPVVPPGARTQVLLEAVKQHQEHLEQRFDCKIRFQQIPVRPTSRS